MRIATGFVVAIICILLSIIDCDARVNPYLFEVSEKSRNLESIYDFIGDSAAPQAAPQPLIAAEALFEAESVSQFNFEFNAPYPISSYIVYEGLDSTSLFATSISLSNEYAVVGANGYNIYEGIVHVFKPVSLSEWTQLSTIFSPAGNQGSFGLSVALEDRTLIVGANGFDIYTGKAYIYNVDQFDFWSLNTTLDSPLGRAQGYGYSVSLSGDYCIVGTAINNAFIYELRGAEWTMNSALESPTGAGAHFGFSVSMNGAYTVVGAYSVGGSVGAAYVYELAGASSSQWTLMSTLTSVKGYNSYFGHSVAIHGRNIIVGAPGYRPNIYEPRGTQTADNNGSVAIFELSLDNKNWTRTQVLDSPVGLNSFFGFAVNIHDDHAIIGATGFPNGNLSGAAFSYVREIKNTTEITVQEFNSSIDASTAARALTTTTTTTTVSSFEGSLANSKAVQRYTERLRRQRAEAAANAAAVPLGAAIEGLDILESGSITLAPGGGVGVGVGEAGSIEETGRKDAGIVTEMSVVLNTVIIREFDPLTNLTTITNITETSEWVFNTSFPSPGSVNGEFGYAVDITDTYGAIGADQNKDLRGAVFLASLVPMATQFPTSMPSADPTTSGPSSQPSSVPSSQPSSSPTRSPTAESGLLAVAPPITNDPAFDAGILAALIIGFILLAAIFALIVYCCCCVAAVIPPMKKKKKKGEAEDEDGPFTVHFKRPDDEFGEGELIQREYGAFDYGGEDPALYQEKMLKEGGPMYEYDLKRLEKQKEDGPGASIVFGPAPDGKGGAAGGLFKDEGKGGYYYDPSYIQERIAYESRYGDGEEYERRMRFLSQSQSQSQSYYGNNPSGSMYGSGYGFNEKYGGEVGSSGGGGASGWDKGSGKYAYGYEGGDKSMPAPSRAVMGAMTAQQEEEYWAKRHAMGVDNVEWRLSGGRGGRGGSGDTGAGGNMIGGIDIGEKLEKEFVDPVDGLAAPGSYLVAPDRSSAARLQRENEKAYGGEDIHARGGYGGVGGFGDRNSSGTSSSSSLQHQRQYQSQPQPHGILRRGSSESSTGVYGSVRYDSKYALHPSADRPPPPPQPQQVHPPHSSAGYLYDPYAARLQPQQQRGGRMYVPPAAGAGGAERAGNRDSSGSSSGSSYTSTYGSSSLIGSASGATGSPSPASDPRYSSSSGSSSSSIRDTIGAAGAGAAARDAGGGERVVRYRSQMQRNDRPGGAAAGYYGESRYAADGYEDSSESVDSRSSQTHSYSEGSAAAAAALEDEQRAIKAQLAGKREEQELEAMRGGDKGDADREEREREKVREQMEIEKLQEDMVSRLALEQQRTASAPSAGPGTPRQRPLSGNGSGVGMGISGSGKKTVLSPYQQLVNRYGDSAIRAAASGGSSGGIGRSRSGSGRSPQVSPRIASVDDGEEEGTTRGSGRMGRLSRQSSASTRGGVSLGEGSGGSTATGTGTGTGSGSGTGSRSRSPGGRRLHRERSELGFQEAYEQRLQHRAQQYDETVAAGVAHTSIDDSNNYGSGDARSGRNPQKADSSAGDGSSVQRSGRSRSPAHALLSRPASEAPVMPLLHSSLLNTDPHYSRSPSGSRSRPESSRASSPSMRRSLSNKSDRSDGRSSERSVAGVGDASESRSGTSSSSGHGSGSGGGSLKTVNMQPATASMNRAVAIGGDSGDGGDRGRLGRAAPSLAQSRSRSRSPSAQSQRDYTGTAQEAFEERYQRRYQQQQELLAAQRGTQQRRPSHEQLPTSSSPPSSFPTTPEVETTRTTTARRTVTNTASSTSSSSSSFSSSATNSATGITNKNAHPHSATDR